MANQVIKFCPNVASISKPLRRLLSSNIAWTWNTLHTSVSNAMQDEISSPQVLALYNTDTRTKVSTNAPAYGLGAVLWQQEHSECQPVAFAS